MPREISLKNAVTIISGYSFRRALEADLDGKIFVIQAKNVMPEHPIVGQSGLLRVAFEGKTQTAGTMIGDVLLVSRGSDSGGFKATTVDTDSPNMIAASSVYILRPDDRIVVPGYLAFYLNSEIGQDTLRRIASGSSIQTLLLKELQDLRIELPSMSIQKSLASMYQNISNQTQLLNKRKSLLQDILASTIKSSIHA